MSVDESNHRNARVLHLDFGEMNLIGVEAAAQLADALDRAEADPEVAVIVIQGGNRAFCAGLDVAELSGDAVRAQRLLVAMGTILHRLYASPMPIVAACRGHAVAAGAMLLLCADRRIARDGSYKVGFSEVGQGMPLPRLPVLLAEARLDRRHLCESTLLGRLWKPREALDVGFFDRLVADERSEALAEAERLATIEPSAYSGSLTALRGAQLAEMETLLDRERQRLNALENDSR